MDDGEDGDWKDLGHLEMQDLSLGDLSLTGRLPVVESLSYFDPQEEKETRDK
jgi:hypothetical protein